MPDGEDVSKKRRRYDVGDIVATPLGRVGEVIRVLLDSDNCLVRYIGRDADLGTVELHPRLLRAASARELFAAGVEQ